MLGARPTSDSGREALVDDEGWLTTAHPRSIADGRRTCLGRADDVVNVGGMTVSLDRLYFGGRRNVGGAPAATALTIV